MGSALSTALGWAGAGAGGALAAVPPVGGVVELESVVRGVDEPVGATSVGDVGAGIGTELAPAGWGSGVGDRTGTLPEGLRAASFAAGAGSGAADEGAEAALGSFGDDMIWKPIPVLGAPAGWVVASTGAVSVV